MGDRNKRVSVTMAEQVAAMLGHDRHCWQTGDGLTLEEILSRCGESAAAQSSTNRKRRRFLFSDGSVLTCSAESWDLGFAGCFCQQTAGHDEAPAADGHVCERLRQASCPAEARAPGA
ncbi:MAG TPA: hypothetical protein VFA86_11680 [Gammaproteobacteria bacterium]|nr:hypothetical protein [Gammaproteobacteria bacterium]